jgi:hypothetical protein
MNFAWITWRQHRLAIVSVAALALVAAVFLAAQSKIVRSGYDYYTWHVLFGWTPYAPTIFGALIAAFWAAPLVSREYENRTNLLVWSQDVSPKRWLISKAAMLAVAATAVTVVVAIATSYMFSASFSRPFSIEVFDANPFVAVAHTLFGIALGLALSAAFRQTLLAVGTTVAAFLGTRVFIAVVVRPYYLPPVQTFQPWQARTPDQRPGMQVPDGGYRIDSGHADAAGNPIDVSEACRLPAGSFDACVKENGVAGHFAIFQPAERIPVFQLIEVAIFLLLTTGLFVFALKRVQSRRRV